ncbi:hypothetical protein D3C72_2325050 [compost metagenome]
MAQAETLIATVPPLPTVADWAGQISEVCAAHAAVDHSAAQNRTNRVEKTRAVRAYRVRNAMTFPPWKESTWMQNTIEVRVPCRLPREHAAPVVP